MKRRDFLKTGLKIGVAANALPVMLGGFPIRALGRSPLRSALETSSSANNNVLVIIQLQGGNDGLNCVVPFTDPNYATLRPTLGLTSSGITAALPDHSSLAFHASMDGFLTLYGNGGGSGNMALIQNVGYPNPILSHFRGTDVWNTATDSGIYASSGWIGRFLAGQYGAPPTTSGSWPLGIEFGNALSDIFLAANGGMGIAMNEMPSKAAPGGQNYDPIPSNPTTQYDELAFVRLIQQESAIYSQTIVSQTLAANKVTYPSSTLATQLAGIARMIASQLQNGGTAQTKIYLVTQGSYDTHSDQISRQASLLTDLSAAALAFQQDIEAFGIADNVAVLSYSEFGRRPAENGSGTDHGTSAPHFIIGTQVIGKVYGSDPDLSKSGLAGSTNPNDVIPSGNMTYDSLYDFRNVYATVINEWLLAGADQSTINAAIQDILTQDSNATYSANSAWNASLGFFKTSSQSVGSNAYAPGLMLLQNYPNPAYGATQIPYVLQASGPVELGIFTSAGVEIARPVDGWQSAGNQQASFDASKLASGAYFYRLTTASGTVTRPMVVEH
ncbi:MAG TPA: DUF1501 domain-containing protein [Candidatus Kapabacteria bacterium]|nr:DUF1501 domain-containing protein [Candidatus Kapabacteria bacterium]